MENYNVVPNIITGKDLDYLSDMFNWNYSGYKEMFNSLENKYNVIFLYIKAVINPQNALMIISKTILSIFINPDKPIPIQLTGMMVEHKIIGK